MKVTPTHMMCKREVKCTIPYALAMLTSPNQFDLQSLTMQEGMLSYSNGRFNDSVVVRLPRAVKHHEGKLYLGLRLFDIPEGSQDYTIVDVTRAVDEEERTKVEMITDSFRLMIKVSKEYKITQELIIFAVCVNLTYIPKDIGVRISFSIDNHVVFCEEFSVRNPPPVKNIFVVIVSSGNALSCKKAQRKNEKEEPLRPSLKTKSHILLQRFAELPISSCFQMDFQKRYLTGCVELEAELYHVRIIRVNLGCFNIPTES
uniref:DUF4773 domain-containing protein n=1 Tax=Parascaris equorum TaxID=6256 RepID=A0A914RFX8_PAREQ